MTARSFQFYNNLSYGLPLAFLVLTPFGLFGLLLILRFLEGAFGIRNDHSRGLKASYKILKQTFGNELTSPEPGVYVLHGVQVPKWKLLIMFASVMCIYFCTLVSFWSDFVFRESEECSDEMDCFAFFENTSSLVQNSPLGEECFDYQASGFTISCYKYVFDYITAIGNSGSVIIVGVLVMTIQSFVSAAMVRTYHNNKGDKCKRRLLAVAAVSYSVISVIFVLLIPGLITIDRDVKKAVWNTRASHVQFASYYFTFALTYFSTGPLFIFKFYPWKQCFESVYYVDVEEHLKHYTKTTHKTETIVLAKKPETTSQEA